MLKFLILALVPCLSLAQDECPALKQCEAPIRATQFFANSDSLVPNKNGVEVLEDVCSKVPTMKSCTATKWSLCNSDEAKEKVESFQNIMEWVCTPEGKQITLDLEKATCTNDPFFEMKFQALIVGCVFAFQSDLEAEVMVKNRPLRADEICPYVVKLDKCVVDESREMCGQELATFVDKIWEISMKVSLSELDCAVSHQHKRRYLEAAMPILNRAR